MKRFFTNLAIVLFIPALYFVFISAFTKSENKGTESSLSNTVISDTTKFINMIMNLSRGDGSEDEIWVKENVDNYKDSLGFNSVHVYPQNDPLYGEFPTTLTSDQKTNINLLIDKVQNKNLKFFYEHIFLSYLCYSQRIVYEVPTVNGNTSANDGFCYRNTSVSPSTDSLRTVLYSPAGSNHQETLLCDSIYENLQHSDFFARQHDDTIWHFRPMVRANLTGIDGEIPIFKIRIMNFAGEEDTSFVIKAKNFRNDGIYYNNYIDKFYDGPIPKELYIFGDTLTGLNKGKNGNLLDCKVDFKIYTYGYVDFWFDKLTVDDGFANKLFDPISLNNFYFLITDILDAVSTQPNLYSLYMDELTYSQLPSTKYVMDKIATYNQSNGKDIKFMVSEANWMNLNKTRGKSLGHRPMLTLLQPRALNVFAYEFYHFGENDTSSHVPGFALNANDIDSRIPDNWITQNYNTYNQDLQYNILGDKTAASGIHDWGSFIYQMHLARKNIDDYSPNTLMYANPQVYGEMWIDSGKTKFTGIIEPTNEEGGVQLMLSLAHGANGFMWYIYQTKHGGLKNEYIKNCMQKPDGIVSYFFLLLPKLCLGRQY